MDNQRPILSLESNLENKGETILDPNRTGHP